MTENQKKIETLKAQIEQHKCLLIYWQTVAFTSKILSKERDAINTMHNHINIIREMTDNLIELIYKGD